MVKGFPLEDVIISEIGYVAMVESPAYAAGNWQVNQHEFSIQAEEVGSFLARDGRSVAYCPVPGADPSWVRLYLNGQVVVALLHQRKIITFHASSFIYDGCGIMMLGESGAGKSSLTASFVLKGAGLLTDDVTPVVLIGSVPHVRPLHGSIRIRRHTAEQLGIDPEKLMEAETGTEKQYMNAGAREVADLPLHVVLKIEVGEVMKPVFDEPLAIEKFSLLRSEVCMWEILAGMPETEADYLQQLVQIIEQVRFVRVVRPERIGIAEMHVALMNYLDGFLGDMRDEK